MKEGIDRDIMQDIELDIKKDIKMVAG